MTTPQQPTKSVFARMPRPKAACPCCGRVIAVAVPPGDSLPFFQRHMKVWPGGKRKLCAGSGLAACWGDLVNPHLFSFAEPTTAAHSDSGFRSHDSVK